MNARTLSLLSLSAVLFGCGGAFAPDLGGGDGGVHDSAPPVDSPPSTFDSGGPDAGGDTGTPWSPTCPASLPAIGSACDIESVQCEYGDAWWNVACDPVVQCQNGQWTTYQASFEPCSPQPGPNPAACPPSYGAVDQGASCSDTNLSCVYAQAVCSCQQSLGGPVQFEDGGEDAYWQCDPPAGCPMPRPRVGSACPSEGLSCEYEECAYAQVCQGGVWQGEEEGCAIAGGTGSSPGQQ